MAADAVTFGWVIRPSAPSSGATGPRGASEVTAGLLTDDRAFIEALPSQFTTLWVEDHFQWGDNPTLECFTTMTHFAALYPKFRMGSIVLGQGYRNPALTAKMAATLQALTGGRFILGLGAGWKQDEYEAYGYDYPPASVRIDQLDEALQIVRTMFSKSPATFNGRYYRVEQAYCEPRPDPPIPLLVGGTGEQKTLRVVAKHADMWNGNFLTVESYAHKQAVLAEHCRAIGRDPNEIVLTYYGLVDLSDAQEAAGGSPHMHFLNGDTQGVATELQGFIDLGVRHFILGFTDFPSRTGLERFTREVLPALSVS
jgi:alkanesulfonate monooxygenase SsuD/methylene tetrahydromethanopterin reductase-like flavin-dependent oxidoreductase (luciferase family)